MKRSNTYDMTECKNDYPYRNRDMKDIGNRKKAEDSAHLMRLLTYLMIAAALSALSWMFDRPNHPFKDPVIQKAQK